MKELKRWAIANKLYLMMFILIILIAYIDTLQINTFFAINTAEAWNLYNTHTLPSFIKLWLIIVAIPAIVYYLFAKDISEALGIFATGFILLFTGVEDVFYFIFSTQSMSQCMQWFNDLNAPVATWARVVFNQSCVSPEALISFAILGIVVSYFVFKKLKQMGYRNGVRVHKF
jgi:hypothetical protein